MAENKKSFIAYSDWNGMFKALPDDVAGKLIKHVFSYVNDENPESDDYVINALFEPIKCTLKRDLKKWEKQHQQRVEAGIKSAEVRKQNATSVNERSISSTVSDSVSVSDNVNTINNIYKKFVDEVKNGTHQQAVDMMYMNLKIKKGSLTPLLKEFHGQLIIDGVVHKNTTELRTHFYNWLNKQDMVNKLNGYKLKT